MIPAAYFCTKATDLFDTVAGLNDQGVSDSFRAALLHVRRHFVDALKDASPGGSHDQLRYNFHIGTSLLMSTLDGLAVYVEMKVKSPPSVERIYWDSESTFIDPRFFKLRQIREKTSQLIIPGSLDVSAIRSVAKHYLPWVNIASMENGNWDIRFPLSSTQKTGPVLRGLLFPLFDLACAAYYELAKLLGQEWSPIDSLCQPG
jgi:hypothetical protein